MAAGTKVKKQKRYVERPDVRQKLLDAAESVVREEGYAAATVRRVSSRAGMTHQAVFYYFGSQDELLLALLRRSNQAYCDRLNDALHSDHPIRGLWELVSDENSTRLGLEFMALANHNETIREEIAANAIAIRALETEAIQKHLEARGIVPRLSPQLVSILTNSLARLVVQEATLGIHVGHEEAERLVDESLRHFESRGDSNNDVEPIVASMAPSE
ncbi:TetR/AcrR family transcriptional regulator [Haliea sp. E17]|uniref:TetR/AcrR family transcriptional regulator n=1 Tax=Haliea sp. E17 TaxID=3401576 RepID=UPI003AAC0CD6